MGVTKTGQHFSFVVRAGRTLTAAERAEVATAASSCILDVFDPWMGGFDMNATTYQTCTGDYGWQATEAQFWRSSWSGWRGYGSGWNTTSSTSSSRWNIGWNNICDRGHGAYNYVLAAKGYSKGTGWSPIYGSADQQRWNCGPSWPKPPGWVNNEG